MNPTLGNSAERRNVPAQSARKQEAVEAPSLLIDALCTAKTKDRSSGAGQAQVSWCKNENCCELLDRARDWAALNRHPNRLLRRAAGG